MGKVLFSQASVCPHPGGGTPLPCSFPGHWSQALSGGYPHPGWGDTPILAGGTAVPPLARSGWGTPSQVRIRYPLFHVLLRELTVCSIFVE